MAALHGVANWIKTFVARPHKDLGRPGPVCSFVPGALERRVLWLAPIVAQATDFSVQLQLVAAGIGVALVPRLAARGLPEGLQLLPVHPAVERHHFALARRSARSDPGIRRIVELLKDNALRVLDQLPPAMTTPSNEAP
jgi:DNA-binding transcriptional LysR family regulator